MRKTFAILLTAALMMSLASCAVKITVGAPAEPEPDYGVGLANLTVVRDIQGTPGGQTPDSTPGTPAEPENTPSAGQEPPEKTDTPTPPEETGSGAAGEQDPPENPGDTTPPDGPVDPQPPVEPEDPEAGQGGEDGTTDEPDPGPGTQTVEPPADEPPTNEPPKLTAEEMRAIAESMMGSTVDALIAAIGEPGSSDYVPSCLVDGEDGMLYYEGFTVYTARTAESEVITYVE